MMLNGINDGKNANELHIVKTLILLCIHSHIVPYQLFIFLLYFKFLEQMIDSENYFIVLNFLVSNILD